MKSVRFHDSKLKLVKALLFRSFHETEAPTAGFVQRLFVEGRIVVSLLFLGSKRQITAVLKIDIVV